MRRWTISVTYLICETKNLTEEKIFNFDDWADFDQVLETAGINWFSIISINNGSYNGNKGKPISLAQLFFEGDVEQMGAMH